jgi:hypothetical protein
MDPGADRSAEVFSVRGNSTFKNDQKPSSTLANVTKNGSFLNSQVGNMTSTTSASVFVPGVPGPSGLQAKPKIHSLAGFAGSSSDDDDFFANVDLGPGVPVDKPKSPAVSLSQAARKRPSVSLGENGDDSGRTPGGAVVHRTMSPPSEEDSFSFAMLNRRRPAKRMRIDDSVDGEEIWIVSDVRAKEASVRENR